MEDGGIGTTPPGKHLHIGCHRGLTPSGAWKDVQLLRREHGQKGWHCCRAGLLPTLTRIAVSHQRPMPDVHVCAPCTPGTCVSGPEGLQQPGARRDADVQPAGVAAGGGRRHPLGARLHQQAAPASAAEQAASTTSAQSADVAPCQRAAAACVSYSATENSVVNAQTLAEVIYMAS